MAKSTPTTTNAPQATAAGTNLRVATFVEDTHRGHEMTHVGQFLQRGESVPHDVWYCQRDHALLVA